MNQQNRVFFAIVCMVFSLHSMELETSKQISDIKKVIYAPGGKSVTEVVFVQNNHVVINGYKKNNIGRLQNLYAPQLVELETGNKVPFCSEKEVFQALTANPDKTKVALFKCGDRSHEVLVHDFITEKKYISQAGTTNPSDCNILFHSDPDNLFLYDTKGNHVFIDYVNNDAKLNWFLDYTVADIGKPLSYFQKKKYYCASAWCVIDGLRMDDFKICSVDELTKQGYVFTNICESQDGSFIIFRATHDMESLTQADFEVNRWYAVYAETKKCIPLEHGDNHTWSACIHPNNKVVAIASVESQIGRISYCCAQTGKLIAKQEYHHFIDQTCSLMNYWGGKLSNISFSADSTMLVAALSECVVFNVPFEVNYGVGTKKELAKLLLLLRNYEPALPEDIIKMLTLKTMRVSKL